MNDYAVMQANRGVSIAGKPRSHRSVFIFLRRDLSPHNGLFPPPDSPMMVGKLSR
jgi:hypothetical protein